MKKKVALADVGELGWSLHLVGHARWLKEQDPETDILVVTYPDREFLYKDLATVQYLPPDFYSTFPHKDQDGFGISGVQPTVLKDYLVKNCLDGHRLPDDFAFRCKRFSDGREIHKPFEIKSISARDRILIFPRCRDGVHEQRNLPKDFYISLVDRLCKRFPTLKITSVGKKGGAYDLSELTNENFENRVSDKTSLEDVVELCSQAVVAIGSQSSLPLISMLQGVPTFVIGHDENRLMIEENWMKTTASFYKVADYKSFDFELLYNKTLDFLKKYIFGDVIEYDVNYYFNMLKMYSATSKKIADTRWEFIMSYFQPKTVLDYGSGVGFFKAFAPAGVEVDNVDVMPVPQTGITKDRYDLVCFWDVLEHFPTFHEPDKAIAMTDRVALTVPVIPPGVDLYTWKHYKPGEHLHYFQPETMDAFFKSRGFKRVKWGMPECPPRQDIQSFIYERIA